MKRAQSRACWAILPSRTVPCDSQLDHHPNSYDLKSLIMVAKYTLRRRSRNKNFTLPLYLQDFKKLQLFQQSYTVANSRMKFSVKYPRRTRPFKSGVCTCTENPDPIPRKKHRSALRRSDPRLSKVALAFLMVAWRKRALGRDVQETKMKISEKWYIFCQKR